LLPIQKQVNAIAQRFELPPSMKIFYAFHVSLFKSYKEFNIVEREQSSPSVIIIDKKEKYEIKHVFYS